MKDRTYRYAENNLLYPFGYGLTYGDIVCTSVSYRDGIADVAAENRGQTATEDVIELYIKDYSENADLNVSLCGFRRVRLEAGEKITVSIPVSERAFTAVDEKGTRKRFGNRFTLYAGTHQPDDISNKLCKTLCAETDIAL